MAPEQAPEGAQPTARRSIRRKLRWHGRGEHCRKDRREPTPQEQPGEKLTPGGKNTTGQLLDPTRAARARIWATFYPRLLSRR